jgi:malate dehydrogenase (oxaloacetate-decarboxylating)
VIASGARRVTDAMFTAAAAALAGLSPTLRDRDARLLPPVTELRAVAVTVALATARQAQADGVAEMCDEATLLSRIASEIWEPVYRPYRRTR